MHECFNQSSLFWHEHFAQARQLWLTRGTCEPVVAILVSSAAVSCEVVALVVLKVGLLEAVMIIGQSPHAAGPWPLDHQVPAHTFAHDEHTFVHGCCDLLTHSHKDVRSDHLHESLRCWPAGFSPSTTCTTHACVSTSQADCCSEVSSRKLLLSQIMTHKG